MTRSWRRPTRRQRGQGRHRQTSEKDRHGGPPASRLDLPRVETEGNDTVAADPHQERARLNLDSAEHHSAPGSDLHHAATVAATRPRLKERIGWPAYLAPAAVAALRRPVPMTVRHDDEPEREILAWSVLAANCTRVRGGVALTPGGLVDDGLLDVLEVIVRWPVQWVGVAAKGTLGWQRDVSGLRTRASRSLTVTSRTPLHVQLDGDVLGPARRLSVHVEEHALSVRAPTGTAST